MFSSHTPKKINKGFAGDGRGSFLEIAHKIERLGANGLLADEGLAGNGDTAAHGGATTVLGADLGKILAVAGR